MDQWRSSQLEIGGLIGSSSSLPGRHDVVTCASLLLAQGHGAGVKMSYSNPALLQIVLLFPICFSGQLYRPSMEQSMARAPGEGGVRSKNMMSGMCTAIMFVVVCCHIAHFVSIGSMPSIPLGLQACVHRASRGHPNEMVTVAWRRGTDPLQAQSHRMTIYILLGESDEHPDLARQASSGGHCAPM